MSQELVQNRLEFMLRSEIEKVQNGEAPAVPLMTFLHHMEKIMSDAKAELREAAMNEVRGTEGVRIGGYIVNLKAGGGRWSFSHIHDWKVAKEQLAAVEERHKASASAAKMGLASIDEDTGEVIPVAIYQKYDDTLQFSKAK